MKLKNPFSHDQTKKTQRRGHLVSSFNVLLRALHPRERSANASFTNPLLSRGQMLPPRSTSQNAVPVVRPQTRFHFLGIFLFSLFFQFLEQTMRSSPKQEPIAGHSEDEIAPCSELKLAPRRLQTPQERLRTNISISSTLSY